MDGGTTVGVKQNSIFLQRTSSLKLGSVRKVLWERACPAMECEALPYPISTSVKVAVNSGFAAALRQIAGQARTQRRMTILFVQNLAAGTPWRSSAG